MAEVETRTAVVTDNGVVVVAASAVEESDGLEEGLIGGPLKAGATTHAVVGVASTEASAFGAEDSDELELDARVGVVK